MADPGGSLSLLIVDDDPRILELAQFAARSTCRFRAIQTAENGGDALCKITTSESLPDVVLTDLSMPQMSGADAIERIIDEFPDARIIVALGQIAHVAAARALGLPPTSTRFGHGAENVAPDGRILLSSYHCSRYNQNTGRLNAAMFENIFRRALELRRPQ